MKLAEQALPAVAFNELTHRLLNDQLLTLTQFQQLLAPGSNETPNAPLFVTWLKSGELRGCIGTFRKLPSLEEGVRSYSRIAAFEDHRFRPIKAKEIPNLSVSVTRLGPMQAINDPYDWVIGEHGIRAEYTSGKSSVFLPEVASEQGWDHDDTLIALRRKAGASSGEKAQYSRFEGFKSKLSFAEYNQLLSSL